MILITLSFYDQHRKVRGNDFYKAKNYESAVSAYTQAIALDGTNAAIKTNRAAAYLMQLMYKEAKDDCDAALAIDSANSKALFRKATALKGLGKLEEAIATLDEGLKHDPNSAAALAEKDSLEKAKIKIQELKDLMTAKKFGTALTQVDLLIKQIGTNFRAVNLLKVECLIELSRPEDAYNLSNIMVRVHGSFIP